MENAENPIKSRRNINKQIMKEILFQTPKFHLTVTKEGNIEGFVVKRKGLFKKYHDEFSLEVKSLTFFATFRCAFRKKRVLFGTSAEDCINIKVSADAADTLQKYIKEAQTQMNAADAMNVVTKHLFFSEHLWVNPNSVIFLQRKSFLLNKFELNNVACEDVAFFNVTGSIKKRIYFGYYDQIDFQSPNSEFADRLHQYLKNHGAKIGERVSAQYNSFFRISKFYNPTYWFTKESLAFTEEAIVYNKKTFAGVDSIYLPYNQISLVFPSKGWFFKRVCIMGEMHVITKQPFKRSVIKKIVELVKQHGINSIAKGITYKPSLLWFRWLRLWERDMRLIIGEKNVYVTPGAMGGLYRGIFDFSVEMKDEDWKEQKNALESTFSVVSTSAIKSATFEKKHFWNLCGLLLIEFEEQSIRKDQQDVQTAGCIVVRNICAKKGRDVAAKF